MEGDNLEDDDAKGEDEDDVEPDDDEEEEGDNVEDDEMYTGEAPEPKT